MAVWTDLGENWTSNVLFGSRSPDSTLKIGLYTAPTYEPGETATLNDLTEPSGNGYSRISLSRGSWTISGDTATYAEVTFTASGGNWGNVYGYFICTSTDGLLLAAEQFANGPYNVTDGSSIKITPKIRIS